MPTRRRANAFTDDNPFAGRGVANEYANPTGFPGEPQEPVTTRPRGGDVDRGTDLSLEVVEEDDSTEPVSREAGWFSRKVPSLETANYIERCNECNVDIARGDLLVREGAGTYCVPCTEDNVLDFRYPDPQWAAAPHPLSPNAPARSAPLVRAADRRKRTAGYDSDPSFGVTLSACDVCGDEDRDTTDLGGLVVCDRQGCRWTAQEQQEAGWDAQRSSRRKRANWGLYHDVDPSEGATRDRVKQLLGEAKRPLDDFTNLDEREQENRAYAAQDALRGALDAIQQHDEPFMASEYRDIEEAVENIDGWLSRDADGDPTLSYDLVDQTLRRLSVRTKNGRQMSTSHAASRRKHATPDHHDAATCALTGDHWWHTCTGCGGEVVSREDGLIGGRGHVMSRVCGDQPNHTLGEALRPAPCASPRTARRHAFRDYTDLNPKPQVGNNPLWDPTAPRAEDRAREAQNYDTGWRGEREAPYYEPLSPVYPRPGDEPENVDEYEESTGVEPAPKQGPQAEGRRTRASKDPDDQYDLCKKCDGVGDDCSACFGLGLDPMPKKSSNMPAQVVPSDLPTGAAEVRAGDLVAGDAVLSPDGTATVVTEVKDFGPTNTVILDFEGGAWSSVTPDTVLYVQRSASTAGHCNGCGRMFGPADTRTVVYTGGLKGEWCSPCAKREDVGSRWDKVSIRCTSCGQQGKIDLNRVSSKTKCRCGSKRIDFTDRVAKAQRRANKQFEPGDRVVFTNWNGAEAEYTVVRDPGGPHVILDYDGNHIPQPRQQVRKTSRRAQRGR